MAQGGEPEQGVDGGQADVAGAHRAAPVLFEMVEERADQRGVEIGEVESGRSHPCALVGELDEEPEAVTVGGDRVATGLALTAEPFGEERFESGGDRAHDRAS